jgi:tetratricopeptide (TPR) repeat protein
MSGRDWSSAIAELTPFVQGKAIEFGGPAAGMIPGAVPLARIEPHGGHDWSRLADGSVDTLVSVGALDTLRDPIAEIHQWRRVLREGGTLALVPQRLGPPLWLIGMLGYLGGFEILQARSLPSSSTWLLVGQRSAVAEIRGPLATLGPRIAAVARQSNAGLAELRLQIGALLLQAGDVALAMQCYGTLLDSEERLAEGLLGLGMCHGERAAWPEAEGALRRALALAPDDERVRRWLRRAEDNLRPEAALAMTRAVGSGL